MYREPADGVKGSCAEKPNPKEPAGSLNRRWWEDL